MTISEDELAKAYQKDKRIDQDIQRPSPTALSLASQYSEGELREAMSVRASYNRQQWRKKLSDVAVDE